MNKIRLIAFLFAVIALSNFVIAQDDTDTSMNRDRQRMKEHPGMPNQDQMQSQGDMQTMMRNMQNRMRNVKLTGDTDKDFALLMTEHEQGAINMSEKYIQEGKSSELKSMARKTIKNDQSNIEALKKYNPMGTTGQTGMDHDMGNMGMGRTDTTGNQTMGMGRTDKSGDQTMGMGRTDTSGRQTMGMSRTDSSMESAGARTTQTSTSDIMEGMDNMMDQMRNFQPTGDVDKDYATMMTMHHQETIKMAENYLNKGQDSELKSLTKKIVDNSRKEITDLDRYTGLHTK